jgi:hypothetical protein
LVIEFSGDSTEFSWNPFPIKQLKTLELEKWNKINHNFQIPEKAKNAQVIKVYLYNPTEQTAFLDDLKVQFK